MAEPKNCDVEIDGDELVCRVDLTKEVGPSSTMKTIIVGMSSGPKPVPGHDGYSYNITVFKKPQKRRARGKRGG